MEDACVAETRPVTMGPLLGRGAGTTKDDVMAATSRNDTAVRRQPIWCVKLFAFPVLLKRAIIVCLDLSVDFSGEGGFRSRDAVAYCSRARSGTQEGGAWWKGEVAKQLTSGQ